MGGGSEQSYVFRQPGEWSCSAVEDVDAVLVSWAWNLRYLLPKGRRLKRECEGWEGVPSDADDFVGKVGMKMPMREGREAPMTLLVVFMFCRVFQQEDMQPPYHTVMQLVRTLWSLLLWWWIHLGVLSVVHWYSGRAQWVPVPNADSSDGTDVNSKEDNQYKLPQQVEGSALNDNKLCVTHTLSGTLDMGCRHLSLAQVFSSSLVLAIKTGKA